ncbi:MAG: hypothetical protein AAF518_06350 [Spirochaetota bacterium]
MMKFLLSFTLLFSLFSCRPEELKVLKVSHCENFNSSGKCTQASSIKKQYRITIAADKEVKTWLELANYMYFHSRQTPGLIIRFNRKFTLTEMQSLKRSLRIYYDFAGSRGKVEGVEVGENWIGIFQYLGAMLREKIRQEERENDRIKLEKIFPVSLKFIYTSEMFQGERETDINVVLEKVEDR